MMVSLIYLLQITMWCIFLVYVIKNKKKSDELHIYISILLVSLIIIYNLLLVLQENAERIEMFRIILNNLNSISVGTILYWGLLLLVLYFGSLKDRLGDKENISSKKFIMIMKNKWALSIIFIGICIVVCYQILYIDLTKSTENEAYDDEIVYNNSDYTDMLSNIKEHTVNEEIEVIMDRILENSEVQVINNTNEEVLVSYMEWDLYDIALVRYEPWIKNTSAYGNIGRSMGFYEGNYQKVELLYHINNKRQETWYYTIITYGHRKDGTLACSIINIGYVEYIPTSFLTSHREEIGPQVFFESYE